MSNTQLERTTMTALPFPKASIYDFTVKDAQGNDVAHSCYKGKVLLVVTFASKCALTNSYYNELSQMYEKYRNQGPSAQNPVRDIGISVQPVRSSCTGTNEQILKFACTRYKAEYPIFDKIDVNGENAAPIYNFLKSCKRGPFGDDIKWNSAMFLIDQECNVVKRYGSTTPPLSIENDIKKLLGMA